MRTLAHLSDLHFGRVDPGLVEPCLGIVRDARPDVTVVSGDLTQRARSWQFREAADFLNRLPGHRIVIPGNHDVPLHNIFARFMRPLSKYRRYISEDLEPFYQDDEIGVVAMNTAKSFTVAGGTLRPSYVARARARLCTLPQHLLRIVVTHHPFELPPFFSEKNLVRHAVSAMAELAACGADIFLAGHLHVYHSELTTRRYRIPGHSAILVQAGTGLSTRTRGETNTFNILRVSSHEVTIQTFAWIPLQRRFTHQRTEHFCRSSAGWVRRAS